MTVTSDPTDDDFLPGARPERRTPEQISRERGASQSATAFVRVPENMPATPPTPLTAADPILRGLSRSGRADVMEAIADLLDPADGSVTGPPTMMAAAAHVLRVLAPRERRS